MTESTSTNAPPPSRHHPDPEPHDWVPVDQRVAGFDRRTIWPGIVLLVVWALWAHVMPWINTQIEVDNPVTAGDVVDLGGREVTFVPAQGWNLESGTLVDEGGTASSWSPSSAVLSSDVVSYSAKSGNWGGNSTELADRAIDVNDSLDQLLAKDEQGRTSITNAEGVPGELVYVLGADQAVLIATFVFDRETGSQDIGVEIEARGTPAALKDQVEDIASMVETTTYRPEGKETTS